MIYQIFSDVIYIIDILALCSCFLGLRMKKKNIGKLLTVTALLVIYRLVDLYAGELLKNVCFLCFPCFTIYFFYEEPFQQAMVLGVWITVVQLLLFFMASSLSNVLGTIFPEIVQTEVKRWLSEIIILLLVLILSGILHKSNRQGFQRVQTRYIVLFTVIVAIDICLLVFFDTFLEEFSQLGRKFLFECFFFGMIVGIFIQVVILLFFIESRNVYQEQEALAREYLAEQRRYYTYLQERERDTKKFRHDIRAHLGTMQALCRQGDYEQISSYLETISGMVESLRNRYSVGNDIVDAILNQYAAEADRQGVELIVTGHFPVCNSISAYDLCTIFSNLLKNAIEAAGQCDNKKVTLHCGYSEGSGIVTVENEYGGVLEKEGSFFRTSKEDTGNHGFGLQNVEECVARNGGTLELEAKEHHFKAAVDLPGISLAQDVL